MNELRLQGKTAIVVGSTSGMGMETAKEFAREGAKVVVSGRRIDRGEKIVADIKAAGGEAIFVQTDATVIDQLKNLIDSAYNAYGSIDILVNNNGIEWFTSFMETTFEDFEVMINANLRSHFASSKFALEYMLKQKSGVILNISSATTTGVIPNINIYAMAKAGVNLMTKCIAKEFAEVGIRCNAILPGLIHTEIMDRDPNPEGLRQLINATVPLKHWGEPEDIAKAAVYLCSDEAKYTTGVLLCVDGGQTM
ncbi:MAG: SDR family oxidoreductase [Coriobacteriales bacterium]|jgi:3-oxoacyl-[acyl-carrier protein] reductase|nr:SDR family oxidoreductase [Coriobacteriales bacterium]